jgi:ABC-type Fe3+-siderophore transport system permease subunit
VVRYKICLVLTYYITKVDTCTSESNILTYTTSHCIVINALNNQTFGCIVPADFNEMRRKIDEERADVRFYTVMAAFCGALFTLFLTLVVFDVITGFKVETDAINVLEMVLSVAFCVAIGTISTFVARSHLNQAKKLEEEFCKRRNIVLNDLPVTTD